MRIEMPLIRLCIAVLMTIVASGSVELLGQNRRPGPKGPSTKQCPDVTVHPSSLPNGRLGRQYQRKITASPAGGNYVYSVTSGELPSGLSLSPNGVLSGWPKPTGPSTSESPRQAPIAAPEQVPTLSRSDQTNARGNS